MQQNAEITIRRAVVSDAFVLAKVILTAGRAHVRKGIWEVILGGTEEEVLRFLHHLAITTIPHLFQYSQYLIAEEETRPVGGLGGYCPGISGYQALEQAIPEVVGKLKLQKSFRDSLDRAGRILGFLPAAPDDAWVIDSVATFAERRRKGTAEKLLRTMLEIGKSRGHGLAQVNVYIGNEPALNLYRKCGFEISGEKRDAYFEKQIGPPGMFSLTRAL